MTLPDYTGGGIVNLMRSLADTCGAPALPQAPLAAKVSPRRTAQTYVLLVIDGLGDNHLQRARSGGTLHRHARARLTSVFPSTTASAVTTFLTGLAPRQHALTGWHMYFSEIDAITAVLPLQPRGGGAFGVPPDALARRLFGHPSFVDHLPRCSLFLSPRAIAGSAFTRYHSGHAEVRGYDSLDDFFAQLGHAIRCTREPQYIYAYYPELDRLAHRHGITSRQVDDCLAAFDEGFAALLVQCAGHDAVLIACADHGFIDSPEERRIDLATHPELAALLARPLCGEQRVAYCYLKPGLQAHFDAYVQEHLAQAVTLQRAGDLITQGWFGPDTGADDARLAARIGDRVLVLREDWTLFDRIAGEKPHRMIGQHGGLSEDEMYVPLVLADCLEDCRA